MATVRLLISGRVQGVYYRASAKEKADALGIVGWVRNTADGSVEVLAAGTDEALENFVQWCWQGPGGAKVVDVMMTPLPGEDHKDFSIRR